MEGRAAKSRLNWDEQAWNRHYEAAHSALLKRDVLGRSLVGDGFQPGSPEEARREQAAWAAKARAHLRRLEALARTAPASRGARRKAHELRSWVDTGAPF
jgi:hypothetical protein